MLIFGMALAGTTSLTATRAPAETHFTSFTFAGSEHGSEFDYRFAGTVQMRVRRHVIGTHISALERTGELTKKSMFSLAVHYGFQVVQSKHLVLMPFLSVGAYVQPGIAGRASVPIGPVRLGVDGSVGYTWELPFSRRSELDPETRQLVYGTRPEAGIWVQGEGPFHPSGRLGVIGRDPVASVQIGKAAFLRGAVSYDLLDQQPTAWVSLGLDLSSLD